MDKINNNITFFLEEKNNDNKDLNDIEIQKMLSEFQEGEVGKENYMSNIHNNLLYCFNNDTYYSEIYYNQEYSVKDLLKICQYYGIDKNIKTSKCKKQDIISTIIFFESLPENFELVQKRHKMWTCITELINDPKMKKYIIWN
jgi:hypothetical protein